MVFVHQWNDSYHRGAQRTGVTGDRPVFVQGDGVIVEAELCEVFHDG